MEILDVKLSNIMKILIWRYMVCSPIFFVNYTYNKISSSWRFYAVPKIGNSSRHHWCNLDYIIFNMYTWLYKWKFVDKPLYIQIPWHVNSCKAITHHPQLYYCSCIEQTFSLCDILCLHIKCSLNDFWFWMESHL